MSLQIFTKIAEERIREAIEQGEFHNLPGQGQPINLEDDFYLDSELRMPYKILKNAGYIPPELELLQEIKRIEDLLINAPEELNRYQAITRLNYLRMKFGVLRPGTMFLDKHFYIDCILDRFCNSK